MEQAEVLKLLEQVGALITNSHLVYTSGRHGSAYVNKDAVYPHTELTSQLCQEIASKFADIRVEVVIAPAIGGVILSQWVAYHLTRLFQEEVFGIYAEKTMNGGFAIRRGYDQLVAGKLILVVEDVLTTGGSARKVIKATRAADGIVVGLGVLVNRGRVTSSDVGYVTRLVSLVDLSLNDWEEGACPLCAQGVPINTKVGKGREFLARQG